MKSEAGNADLVRMYLRELETQGFSEGTIRYRRTYLEQALSFFQQHGAHTPGQISRELVWEYQLKISQQNFKPLTVHSKLSVLSCFLKWLLKKKYLAVDLSLSIDFPKRPWELPHNIPDETEIRMLLSLPNIKTDTGIRDKAMLELLYTAGIRRAELVSLDLYDLNRQGRTVRVKGKYRKERLVPVGDVAMFWLGKYIESVRKPKRSGEQALFLDMVRGRRLSRQTLNRVVSEYRKQSGLKKRITPHTLRHACATHLLKSGADIRHIQELLGHASPETTQLYTRVEITDLQQVFRSSHPRACKA